MTEDELRDAFEIYESRNASGAITYFNLPQDIIENTRRAFNPDPTSPTGYPAGEEPTGRYIAPASQPGCIALFTFDCGTPEQLWVRGPWFSRWDLKFKKRFPIGGRATFDIDFEMLNAFNNTNFNPNFNPGSGNTIFQVTSGYTDINTTFDPGGRLGQIVTRSPGRLLKAESRASRGSLLTSCQPPATATGYLLARRRPRKVPGPVNA